MKSQQAINLLKGLEQSLDDYCELNDEGKAAFRMAITALELFGNAEQLPSAQPETHEERTETHGVCLDTIDRQAALDWLKNEWNGMVTSLFDGIKALPSAQPEIIHCRDCKHWREGDAYSYCQKLFNCGVLDVYDYMRADDDFCSEAERRTNG